MHTTRVRRLHGIDVRRYGSGARLLGKPGVTAVVDTDRLKDAKVRQGYRLGRTLTAEDVSAVSAVVFAIGKSESFSAAHADIGIGPFGWSTAVEHGRGDVSLGRETEAFSL